MRPVGQGGAPRQSNGAADSAACEASGRFAHFLFLGSLHRRSEAAAMMSSRERRICDLLGPSIQELGYETVGVVLEPSGGGSVLRVFIDRDGGISIDDCERASRQIGAVLDVEDPIEESYVLEVSSPGLDRPLLSEAHFVRFAGCQVRLRTTRPMDGRRGWTGRLVGCREGHVVVREGEEDRLIPLDLVGRANLVPEV